MIPPGGLGSGQLHPDQSGAKGDQKRRERPVGGNEFPYDRHRGQGLGTTFTVNSYRTSADQDPAWPADEPEMAEAVGVPFSQALSSRFGQHSGMAAIQPDYGQRGTGKVDPEELERAGQAGGVWERLESLVDMLTKLGMDVELSGHPVDKDTGVRPIATVTRSLNPPEETEKTMKITVAELRRMVYEAVAQAKGSKRASEDAFDGEEPDDRFGPDGHELPVPGHDLSRPPANGGRLRRQGRTTSSPVFTSENKVKQIVRSAVRDALRR